MGIFANKPRFTVIDKNPSPTKTVSNFGLLDYLEMTTITGASVPVGYLAGGRCGLRGSCMYTAGLIGLLGGFMFAYESSAGRLMGLFPNQDEVEKYKK